MYRGVNSAVAFHFWLEARFETPPCKAMSAYLRRSDKHGGGVLAVVVVGVHLDGVDLVACGYKYKRNKTLFFLWTKGAGRATWGEPFLSKFNDEHGNVCTICCIYLHPFVT